MKFKTFCACLSLLMYAGTVSAMESDGENSLDSSFFFYEYDKDGTLSWDDYQNKMDLEYKGDHKYKILLGFKSMKEEIKIRDPYLSLYLEDLLLVNKNCDFLNLETLDINMKGLSGWIDGRRGYLAERIIKSVERIIESLEKECERLERKAEKDDAEKARKARERLETYESYKEELEKLLDQYNPLISKFGEFLSRQSELSRLDRLAEIERKKLNQTKSEKREQLEKLKRIESELADLGKKKAPEFSEKDEKKLWEVGDKLSKKVQFWLLKRIRKTLSILLLKSPKLVTLHIYNIDKDGREILGETFDRRNLVENLRGLTLHYRKALEEKKNISKEQIKPSTPPISTSKEEKKISKEQIQSFIWNLEKLENLEIRGNEITELPQEIGKLRELKELNLRGNKITELPLAIGDLEKLESLNLRNNNLKELPEFVRQLKCLNMLDLRENPKINSIDKVCDAILDIPALESIKLTGGGEDREYYKEDGIWKEINKRKYYQEASDVGDSTNGVTERSQAEQNKTQKQGNFSKGKKPKANNRNQASFIKQEPQIDSRNRRDHKSAS